MASIINSVPAPLFQDVPGKVLSGGVFDADWLLLISTLPVILFILASLFQRNVFIWLSKVVYSTRYSSASFRNRSPGSNTGHTLLLIVSFMSLATISYFCEILFSFRIWGLSGFALWLVNFGIISVGLGLRFIIIGFIGEFTGSRSAFEEYGFNLAQIYKFIAIPLLIINFLLLYLDSLPDIIFVVVAAILVLNMIIIRIIRLFSVFVRRGFSLFYMILYLCALEFTPILVFAKYISGAV